MQTSTLQNKRYLLLSFGSPLSRFPLTARKENLQGIDMVLYTPMVDTVPLHQ